MIEGFDSASPTWMAIKDWAEAQIQERRDRLEDQPGDEAKHRGAIEMARALLQLADPPKKPLVHSRAPLPDRA